MQILYLVAIFAVFILCVAMLSTARRVLRSSPLASGQLGISRIYDVERPEEDGFEELHSELAVPGIEAEHENLYLPPFKVADREPEPATVYVAHAEIRAEAAVSAPIQPVAETLSEATDFDAFEAAYMHAGEQQETGRPFLARNKNSRDKGEGFHLPRPSRQTYQYALECLLLGVSAWVLIKTQQSNMKYRLQQSSQGRVA